MKNLQEKEAKRMWKDILYFSRGCNKKIKITFDAYGNATVESDDTLTADIIKEVIDDDYAWTLKTISEMSMIAKKGNAKVTHEGSDEADEWIDWSERFIFEI